MGKAIAIAYVIFFFTCVFIIIISRLILLLRIYAVRDKKIFDSSTVGEIIGFLASMTLPFKLKENPDDPTVRIVKVLNKLKTAYWWLMLTLLIFIITLNILEHIYHIKTFE